MTHEEYLELSRTGDSLAAFHQYYGQFVTPYVTEVVRTYIGEDIIRASKDVHFNDIPLELWDKLGLDGFWREVSDTLRQFHLARRAAASSSTATRSRSSYSFQHRSLAWG